MDKEAWRSLMKKRRREAFEKAKGKYDPEALLKSLRQAGLLGAGQRVFSYASFASEAPTQELNQRLTEEGCPVLLPRMSEGSRMDFYSPGEGVLRHSMGMEEPISQEAAFPKEGELFVVPGLAFDLSGGRLGYGKGFYDAYFRRFPKSLKVGLCFEEQVLRAALPVSGADVPMDFLLTPKGLYDIKKGCFL